jgi:hypothetical protein
MKYSLIRAFTTEVGYVCCYYVVKSVRIIGLNNRLIMASINVSLSCISTM